MKPRTPIEMMLDGVQWVETPQGGGASNDGIPHATHEGIFELAGITLRCYRLSDGRAVFHADDVAKWLEGIL